MNHILLAKFDNGPSIIAVFGGENSKEKAEQRLKFLSNLSKNAIEFFIEEWEVE